MDFTEKFANSFVITTELGPVKGVQAFESLENAKGYLPLDGINVQDCPMGNLRINSIAMSALIQQRLEITAIPHFTCRDRSLLGTQADLLGAHSLGIRNLLATTGDPPKKGPYLSKVVYDYNTFELVELVKKMNRGLDFNDQEFGGHTDFKVSCTAMPTSRDLDHEIERMHRKVKAGADFFQTQVVYDTSRTIKFLEKAKPLNKPILIGLLPLKNAKMARYLNEKVHGIDVPEEIIEKMEIGGATGIDIICDFLKKVYPHIDGIHIMAMGDIQSTNTIVEFVRTLGR